MMNEMLKRDGNGKVDLKTFRVLELEHQLEQAAALAWIAVTVSIAILIAVFATHDRGLGEAMKNAEELRVAISVENRVLQQNQRAVESVRAALEELTAPLAK